MRSKFTTRSSSRQGPVITNNYSRAIVKGGPKKKKVRTTTYSTVTNNAGRTVTGVGKTRKRVYKKGVLTKDKTKKMSLGKMLRMP